MSNFLAIVLEPVTAFNLMIDINIMVNWQLLKQVSTDQSHMTILQAQVTTYGGHVFFLFVTQNFA